MFRRTIRRSSDGRYHVHLPAEDRAALGQLAGQLLESLASTDDPGVQRLFPPAHRDDPVGDAEFHLRRHDELAAGRRAALSTFIETADAQVLNEEQLQCWLTSLNDLRLVLGTHLEVSEEMEDILPPDPRAGHYVLYIYLNSVLEDAVDAASGGLP